MNEEERKQRLRQAGFALSVVTGLQNQNPTEVIKEYMELLRDLNPVLKLVSRDPQEAVQLDSSSPLREGLEALLETPPSSAAKWKEAVENLL